MTLTCFVVVDHDEVSSRIVHQALKGAGYEAQVTRSMEEALTALGDRHLGLLANVTLPDGQACDLIRRVRSWQLASEQRKLVVVGYGAARQGHRITEALNLGADAVLRHPIEPTEIEAVLRAVLRRRTQGSLG